MDSFFEELKELLRKYKMDKESLNEWNCFKIDHSVEVDHLDYKKHLSQISKYIKESTNTTSNSRTKGLYLYFCDKGNCLYVGKSKDIASRIYQHYKENLDMSGAQAWRDFFKSHKKQLTIYFKTVDLEDTDKGEALRIVFERFLTVLLAPEFEKGYKTIK